MIRSSPPNYSNLAKQEIASLHSPILKTVLFVERVEHEGKMFIGYHLNRYNYIYAPPGRIRIARFQYNFCPPKNNGYYGDIYMHRMIRRWKQNKKKERVRWLLLIFHRKQLCEDLFRQIVPFL